MIKCNRCNTLYAESANFCLYCKLPIQKIESLDQNEYNFEFNKVSTEPEANQIRIQLSQKGVPCKIEETDGCFKILIEEKNKANAFKESKDKLFLNNEMGSERKGSNLSKVLTYLVLFVLAAFCFFFLQLKFESKPKEENIIYEGTVDTRIMPKKSYAPTKKNVKKQLNNKKQPNGDGSKEKTKSSTSN